jgi:hypothetical protein
MLGLTARLTVSSEIAPKRLVRPQLHPALPFLAILLTLSRPFRNGLLIPRSIAGTSRVSASAAYALPSTLADPFRYSRCICGNIRYVCVITETEGRP